MAEHLARTCAACEERLVRLRDIARATRDAVEEDAELEAAASATAPPRRDRDRIGSRFADLAAEAQRARFKADEIASCVGKGPDALHAAIDALGPEPAPELVLLSAVQKAARSLSRSPGDGLALAERAKHLAGSLPSAASRVRNGSGLTREGLQAEALILECQALTWLGRAPESIAAARSARAAFETARESPFARALCDYFEASALLFAGDTVRARGLLESALQVFAEYGQTDWIGRGESALGDALSSAGEMEKAIPYLDRAVERLDRERDAQAWTATTVNRAATLMHLERLDDAAAAYAEALAAARRHGFAGMTAGIRHGLAECRLRKGDWAGALAGFDALAAEAAAAGLEDDALYASLFAAECEGRLGRTADMERRVAAVRRKAPVVPLDAREALTTLYRALDERDLKADLVASVRELLEGRPTLAKASRTRR